MAFTGTHELALVETDRIGENVAIGPYCVVGPDVTLGDGVRLHPHCVITGDTTLGSGTEVFPGAVIGKHPARSAALSRSPVPGGPVRIGARSSIGAHAVIHEGVRLGDDCLVGDSASILEGCSFGARCIIGRFVSVHHSVKTGDRCRIYDHSHVATATTMGDDCLMGVHVGMASDNAMGRLPYTSDRVRGPSFGDRIRVGLGALFLPGVHIGDDAVVAGGAIVTGDVPAGASVRGIPARLVDVERA